MKDLLKTTEVRVRMTSTDRERLDMLCAALEMTASEVIRYYIRQAHSALGARVTTVSNLQQSLFPITLPDGRTPLTVPIPVKPGDPPK